MITLGLCYLTLVTAITSLFFNKRRFDAQRDSVTYRIHVTGAHGTSAITRSIAAILRDHGLRTFGRIAWTPDAGITARVIMPTGEDAALKGRRMPALGEYLQLVRSFAARKAEAIVIESTITKPRYQAWLEHRVLHSHIMVITRMTPNQCLASHELIGLAQNVAAAIPRNALVITASQQPEVLTILQVACDRQGTRLIQTAADDVRDTDLQHVDQAANKEHIAIGLALAELFKIDRTMALTSMTQIPGIATNKAAATSVTSLPTYNPSQKVRGGLHKIINKLDIAHAHTHTQPSPFLAKLTKGPRNA